MREGKVRKIFGVVLILFSLLGMVLSAAGLVIVARNSGMLVSKGLKVVELAEITLETTDQSLNVLSTMLDQLVSILDVFKVASQDISQTMYDTYPLLDSVSIVLGEDIPAVIDSTQQALETLEQSAGTVDRVLYAMSRISFLTGVDYDPETPLAESVTDIAESLDNLEPSLEAIDQDLKTANQNLQDMEDEVKTLDESLSEIKSGVEDAQLAVEEYHDIVKTAQEELEGIRSRVPRWMKMGIGGILFGLLWMLVLQIYLISEGIQYLRSEEA